MSRTNSITSSVSVPRSEETTEPVTATLPKKTPSKPRTFVENIKQQTLPAWRPTFSAVKISPLLFVLGIVFIPLGVGMLIFSNNIEEISVEYTDCLNILDRTADDMNNDFNKSCADIIDSPQMALKKSCKCRVKFNITTELDGTVYMYYALTNFYQNHRRYLSSRDDNQLKGHTGTANDPKEPSSECDPYGVVEGEEVGKRDIDIIGTPLEGTMRVYYPCGAIANSMFSDVIKLFYNKEESDDEEDFIPVPLNRTGISWESDRNYKFINPSWFDDLATDPQLQFTFVKPLFWKKNLWELDPENPENNGVQNEDFIVWMRTAALSNFRKLYRIINKHDSTRTEFADGLPTGEYMLEIDYNFPVKSFEGSKKIILTTTSVLGASNPFLGITYIITGGLCTILGLLTLVVHVTVKKQLNPKANETQGLLANLKRNEGHDNEGNSNLAYYGT